MWQPSSMSFYAQGVNGCSRFTEMPAQRVRTHAAGLQQPRRWSGSSWLVRRREKACARFGLVERVALGREGALGYGEPGDPIRARNSAEPDLITNLQADGAEDEPFVGGIADDLFGSQPVRINSGHP